MQSHEVLREAAERVGVKILASELRLSPAMVYKWCEEADSDDSEASGTRNPLDRISEIVRLTGHTGVVSWLCHEAGGFFAENPTVKPEKMGADLLQRTQELVAGFSRLLDEVSRSVADDNQIDSNEADRIRSTWESLKTTVESFVVAAERGMYLRPPPRR